jgi:hypothetical protein
LVVEIAQSMLVPHGLGCRALNLTAEQLQSAPL